MRSSQMEVFHEHGVGRSRATGRDRERGADLSGKSGGRHHAGRRVGARVGCHHRDVRSCRLGRAGRFKTRFSGSDWLERGVGRTLAIHRSGTLALVTEPGDLVSVLRLADGSVDARAGSIQNLGGNSSGVVMTPDGRKAYVSNFGSNTVAVLGITDQNGPVTVTDTGIRIFIPSGRRVLTSAFRGWR